VSVDPLLVAAGLCLVGSLGLAIACVAVLRRRPRRPVRIGAGACVGVTALLLAVTAALCATVAAGLSGYRALTREDTVLFVETRPSGPGTFDLRIVHPDGSEQRLPLAGDEFVIEARILKWHPWANLLGLHTAYELDRVSGRYRRLEDEQTRPRTVHGLAAEHPVDLFAWRQRLPWLSPLVDAEYGSGTFTRADRPARFEVRVSTTGLLVREAS
jgi:hypothetical protein